MLTHINARFEYQDNSIEIDFPCSENTLCAKLMELHAPMDSTELFLSEIGFPSELSFLDGTFINLDELNYLAKRMDSFFGDEEMQFLEAMKREGFTDLKDLINLSFNLNRYTLIQNIGDMQKIGIEYVLNTEGSIPTSELEDPKYAEIGWNLLSSGKGIFTSHGMLFIDDGKPFQELYNGQTFPAYYYDPNIQFTVIAEREGKFEYLYLPCEEQAIHKAFRRLGADDAQNVKMSVEENLISDMNSWKALTENILKDDGVYQLNQLARVLAATKCDPAKLISLADYIDMHDSYTVSLLAEKESDFVFIPGAEDNEAVGRYFADTFDEYDISIEMEDFFDFDAFGEYLTEKLDGAFLPQGFVCTRYDMDISEILELDDEHFTMGGI